MKKVLYLLVVVLLSAVSQAVIIYVDADHNTNTSFAPSAGGGAITVNGTDTVDGIWRLRTGFGLSPSVTTPPKGTVTLDSTSTVYESTGNSVPSDNVPRIVTTVGGLAMNTYDVYVYFWIDQAGSPWRIRAGFEDTVDPLPLFIGSNTFMPTDFPISWVASDPAGRRLLQAYLGQVTGTSISVFVEDAPATTNNERTWYDGIGYIPEPASLVLLGLGSLAVFRKRK